MGEIDHEFTDEIVCPYCGYEYSECYEFSEDDDEILCDQCDKIFSYSRHMEVTYTTTKCCVQNKQEHIWSEPNVPHMYNGKWIAGKHCENCNKCQLVDVDQATGLIIKESSDEKAKE